MSWKRVLRAAVCFLVICCLVINISPIKARAVVPAFVVPVGAAIVVAAAFVALGVMASSNSETFFNAVNQCVEALTVDNWIVDGMVNVFSLNSAGQMAVTKSFLEAVRAWLFETGITKAVPVASGDWYYNGFSAKPYPQDVDLSVYPYITMGYGGSASNILTCVFSTQPLLVDSKFSNYAIFWQFVALTDVDILYYQSVNDNMTGWALSESNCKVGVPPGDSVFVLHAYIDGFHNSKNDMWANYDIYGTQYFNYGELLLPGMLPRTDSGEYVTVTGDLASGVIAPESSALSEGYSAWAAGSATVSGDLDGSDDDEVLVYPLGLPTTLEDVVNMSQEQAWTGTYAPTVPEGLTGTLGQTSTNSFLNSLSKVITAPFEWLWSKIESIYTPVEAFVGTLVKEIFVPFEWLWQQIQSLFVPSEDFLTAKVDDLCARFDFADSIVRTGQALFNGLSGITTEPPVIYVDLGASEGPYDLGGKVAFVDLHWYSRYKPTVDAIISSFLWACFVWRLLIKLPGIINGASGAVSIVSGSGGKEDL